MSKKEKSIQEWLKQLRDNKSGAIEARALKVGVTAGSIAAIFSSQLNEYFDKHKRDYVDIRRKDLPALIGVKALKKDANAPTLTPWVRERLRAYGISVTHKRGFVSFKRIKPKHNPQV